ncbi:ankyrin repeat domain-containing protein [Wolbachia endosymbiont (group A) of Nomada ferruginata]|uniref:ankyrin repeat domain-containing protein n=1 Tax=Wolbachia endosymbiont (group A) of Nomada ferruginata TaxID=3066204 RepID=UPI0007EEA58E
MHLAVKKDNIDINVLNALLGAEGINVNVKDEFGEWTPLHWAVSKNRIDKVKALLGAEGIDVNIEGKHGKKTPLHLAAQDNNQEIVEDLIRAGADVNKKDKNGDTPFDLATDDKIKTLLQPAEKSDDGLGGKSPESNEGNPGEDTGTQQKEKQEGNAKEETQTSTNSTVSIKEEGKNYDKSEYFSGSKILDHDYQDKLTNIFINSHCSLNGGERMQLAENIHQIRQIFSKYADNNIYSMWIGVFDIGKLDTDEFKEREIKSSKEKYWKNSIHVRSGDVQDKVLVYSWLDINQFNQDKWNNFLSQLEGDHKVDFIGTGPLTFKYKDFNYRVYPPLFGSSDGEQSSLSNTEVFSFSRTEVNQIIENIKRSHQSIKKQVIDHYASLNKDFVENDVDFVKIITDVNNKTKLTSI